MHAAILATRRTSPLTRTNEAGRGTLEGRAIRGEPGPLRPGRPGPRAFATMPAAILATQRTSPLTRANEARRGTPGGESNQPRAGTPPPQSSRPASLRDDASSNPCDPAYFSADPYKRSGAQNSRGREQSAASRGPLRPGRPRRRAFAITGPSTVRQGEARRNPCTPDHPVNGDVAAREPGGRWRSPKSRSRALTAPASPSRHAFRQSMQRPLARCL
jgi:hypothetical protein